MKYIFTKSWNSLQCVERGLSPLAKISSTTNVELLQWLNGKQQQPTILPADCLWTQWWKLSGFRSDGKSWIHQLQECTALVHHGYPTNKRNMVNSLNVLDINLVVVDRIPNWYPPIARFWKLYLHGNWMYCQLSGNITDVWSENGCKKAIYLV